MSRWEFGPKTKRLARERATHDGTLYCEICDCELSLVLIDYHYDHIHGCWLADDDGRINGRPANSLYNCQVICHHCHKDKSKREAALRAKSRRIRGLTKRVNYNWPSRPMPKRVDPWQKRI